MRKRIVSVFLCCILVISGTFSDVQKVKAAAVVPVAIGGEAAAEAVLAILAVLGVSIAGVGAAEILTDYDSSKELWDSFSNEIVGTDADLTVTLSDGQSYKLKDLQNMITTEGTGALVFPDRDTFARYRLIDGTGGGEEPEEPEQPEEPEKSPFSKIQSMIVGSSFLGQVGSLLKKFINPIEKPSSYSAPVEYKKFLMNQTYTAILPIDAYGYYNFLGYIELPNSEKWIDFRSPKKNFGYITESGYLCFGWYQNEYLYSSGNILANYPNGSGEASGVDYKAVKSYHFNFPVFNSQAEAINYALTGDDSAALNGQCYDFPDVADSVPEILAPITGYPFSPNGLPGLNGALSNAYDSLPTATPATKNENTEKLKETLSKTVIENVPAPVTEPEPEPEPDPNPEPEPGEAESGLSDYKVNLTSIFPFCIPFDFIDFLKALKAEPETPVFEVPFIVPSLGIETSIVIDLSWMDDIMKIFRLGLLGCFTLSLMVNTRKMIKW